MTEEPVSEQSTPERILEAAEALFAQKGVGSVSLRAIVAEAGVNIAAINYHFGSKDELITAMFRRRLAEINGERLRLLHELRVRFESSSSIPLTDLLRVFLKPALAVGTDSARGGKNFFRVAARAHSEPNPVVRQVLFEELAEVIEQFLIEFRRTLPELSEREHLLRMAFVAGAMVQAILFPLHEVMEKRGQTKKVEPEELLENLIDFCVGGMGAEQHCGGIV